MTEVSAGGTHAEVQLGTVSVPSPLPASLPNGTSVPEGAVSEDPSSTIKCICGYNDDDGNTVLCEICNTWQHIECYYPDQTVPDVHECYDDRPRTLDAKAARERQTQLRELQHSEDRRTKRPKSSTHRKKTKDSVSLNGWTGLEQGPERLSDSPRDQPPPAKRPKTSHKLSTSVASINNIPTAANARRKPGANALASGSVKSPPELSNGYSGDYFSPEFMQLHHRPQHQHADGNFMTSIGVTNDLAAWIQDPDELAKVTNGEPPTKVFMRIDTVFEELEEMSPGISRHAEEDKTMLIHGAHPVIQRLTVDSTTPQNAYIGELRGHISRRDEYMQNPANRWSTLRHPEPFVFLPPYLPIVLDARYEGTELRYIRRSCKPNTKMRIIIDKARDCHFCLVSESQINEGDEITLGWHMDEHVMHILHTLTSNGSLKKEGIHGEEEHFISDWASRVLANFGGCACGNPGSCLLGRFDRRQSQHQPDFASTALKLPKGRKGKKGANHASPLSTGRATNSRASSEAANAKHDQGDDLADSRSVSGSSKSKPTSRDNTPGMSLTEPEISIREKRKLEHYERRFDALHDDTPARKKKRNSAGSTLNTPGVGSSRQLGLGLLDSQHPSPPLSAAPKGSRTPTMNGINGQYLPGTSRYGRSVNNASPLPAKTYAEASTQTDIGAQNNYNVALAPCKRRRITYSQRILARTRDDKPKPVKVDLTPQPAQQHAATGTSPPSSSAQTLVSSVAAPAMLPPPRPAPALTGTTDSAPISEPIHSIDNTFADAEGAKDAQLAASESMEAMDTSDDTPVPVEGTLHASEDVVEPPRPTSSTITAPEEDQKGAGSAVSPVQDMSTAETKAGLGPGSTAAGSHRPQNLHVTLPPVPNFSPPTPTTPSMSATPGSITGSSIAQSPISSSAALPPGPLASPAVLSSVAPSPLKKKLSLSDYTSRKRAAAKEAAAQATGVSPESKPLSAVAEGSVASNEDAPELKEEESKSPAAESTAVEDADMPLAPLNSNDDAKSEAASAAEPVESSADPADAASAQEAKPDEESGAKDISAPEGEVLDS